MMSVLHSRPHARRILGLMGSKTPALPRPFLAQPIQTERLLLRPYRKTDLADWLKIESDETVRQGLKWPVRTHDEIRAHLLDRTTHTIIERPGDFLVLAMERDGEVIGDVSLHLRTVARETRLVEVGWLIRSNAGGCGYATEAAEALLDLGFCQLDAVLVTAVIHHNNMSSARLATRLGFRPAGSTPNHITFVLTAQQWRSDNASIGNGGASEPFGGDIR